MELDQGRRENEKRIRDLGFPERQNIRMEIRS